MGGSTHHPTGFVVAPQLCIQSHPIPVTSIQYTRAGVHKEDTWTVIGKVRQAIRQTEGKVERKQGRAKLGRPATTQTEKVIWLDRT